MTRDEQIKRRKIWQVNTNFNPDIINFEGSRAKCLEFVRMMFGENAYRTGRARITLVILEKP